MRGQLRTFIFTTKHDKPFGTVFTTIKELETYIKNNVPPEFHERLLIKSNKSVPGGKDYRFKTLIREFDKNNPLKNNDIQFIHSSDIGCKELLNRKFYHDKLDLDKRIAGEKEEWLMLIPKNKALAYIRPIFDNKYIETTDERITILGKVDFTRLPIKPYTQAAPLIPIKKKAEIKPNKVEFISDTEYAMMHKRKPKGAAKNPKKKESIKALIISPNHAISFRAENWIYLGKPTSIELRTFPDEPGVLYIGNGGKNGIFKAFERDPKAKKRNYNLSMGVKYIRDRLEIPMGKSIERGCYYSAEQIKREVGGKLSKWVKMDFNIIIKEDN